MAYEIILYTAMGALFVLAVTLIARRLWGAQKQAEFRKAPSYIVHLGLFVLAFVVCAILVLTHL